MFSTPGSMQTVVVVLLCSQIMLTVSIVWLARRAWRLWRVVSRSTQRVKAPEKWESKLRELADEVVSLSSSFEKVQRQLMRLNSRAGMRELRAEPEATSPPPNATKAEVRKHYGLTAAGPEFAKAQLALQRSQKEKLDG